MSKIEPNREALKPYLGKDIAVHSESDKGHFEEGKLALVCDDFLAIVPKDLDQIGNKDRMAVIKGQLEYLVRPIFVGSDSQDVLWIYLRTVKEIILVEAGVFNSSSIDRTKNGGLSAQLRSAAWGSEEHIAPPNSPWEFL